MVPAVVPVTLMLNVHEVFGASVAPVKLTTLVAAVATIVPPPQLPASPFGVDTTKPAGSVSVKPTPVNAVEGLLLVIVKLSEVVPFSSMLPPAPTPNEVAMVGGAKNVCVNPPAKGARPKLVAAPTAMQLTPET